MPFYDVPHFSGYIAERYRVETHAPDCDHYIRSGDLAALGITFADASKREARVERELNEMLKKITRFIFTADQDGGLVMAVSNAALVRDAKHPLDFSLEPQEPRFAEMISYIRKQISEAPALVHHRACVANPAAPAFRFTNDDDFVQFKLKFTKVRTR